LNDDKLLRVEKKLLDAKAFPFDVLTLGMGDDGHTASLFPCAGEIYEAMAAANHRLLMKISPATAPYDRISFTLPALLQSREVFLHLTGPAKLEILKKASAGVNAIEMPVRAFIQHAALNLH